MGALPVSVNVPWSAHDHYRCQAIVDGLAAGKARCCQPIRLYSEVWAKIWFKLEDLGIDQITVQWVPSRKSWTEAQRRGVPWLHFRGNQLADKFAKLGARKHPRDEDWAHRRGLAWWASRHVAYYTGRVLHHLSLSGFLDAERPKLKRVFDPLDLVSDPRGHQVKLVGDRWGCVACGKSATSRARVISRPCPGVPDILSRAHPSHRLWWAGNGTTGMVWCSRCGTHGAHQILKIGRECTPPTAWGLRSIRSLKRGKDSSSGSFLPRSFPVSVPRVPREVGWVEGLLEVSSEVVDPEAAYRAMGLM